MFGTKEEHESFGMVGVSRVHGTPRNLFGSSIKHSNSIMLGIYTAEKNRHLSRDLYFARKQLIKIEMSPTQFADMITSMNVGDGVPCTLRSVNYNRKEDPPDVTPRQLFQNEFKKDVENVVAGCKEDVKKIKDILLKKGTITVQERKNAFNYVQKVLDILGSGIPFVQSQFNEAMDNTVKEAKGEVDAFINHKVTSLGIEALKNQLVQLPEETKGGE